MIVKIVGVLKLMVAFSVFIGTTMTFFNLKMNNTAKKIAAMAIISLVFGIYIYYLTLTGIWNIGSKTYKASIPLFIGFVIQFVGIFFLIYYSYTSMPFNVFLTSTFASIAGIAIGIYDFKRLLFSWKNRKLVLK